MKFITGLIGIFVFVFAFALVGNVHAETNCTFSIVGTTMSLDADCTTDETILIDDGFTLDGNGNTITAVDPDGDHFKGAVVANDGASAHVVNLNVTAENLMNTCDAGDNRLRGIMFDGASGSITHSNVYDINQGESGCQEGNAIEVRNEPFNGTHPNVLNVEIAHNTVTDYQKTGIAVNGDVEVDIHHNTVGASATQANLAANSIQLGSGALGSVSHNQVDGNQWLGASNYAATAILLFFVEGVEVSRNNIRGNSDVGIYVSTANGNNVDNNKIFDEGVDGDHGDYGIVNFGTNDITNNKVRGFDTTHYGVTGGKNKAIPGGPNAF